MPQRTVRGGETGLGFALGNRHPLSAPVMSTAIHTTGHAARRRSARTVQWALLAGLLGLAPLAASSAAAPDHGTAPIEPATSTAMSALLPLPATADTAEITTEFPAETAASAPQETVLGQGSASYYAAKFHGRRTASGETFDNGDMTAAHRTLPFGTLVRVTNPANGASVVVRVNDRGPFTKGRMIDVSRAAAEQLGLIARGHATVELALIES